MSKIQIELEVAEAQETASTIRSTVNRIDWVLENKPPNTDAKRDALDKRAQMLSVIATNIETILHKAALANGAKNGKA